MTELFNYNFNDGTVKIYNNRVEILKSGKALSLDEYSGRLIIYLKNLSSIKMKKPTVTTGYIEFNYAGNPSTKKQNDLLELDNVLLIGKGQEEIFATALINLINDLV
ncbi:hypothetical protein [Turicibacter sp. KK003]|uniref:hypothetical protein n=1 Tax=Turicibacter sp. KK003 TaxID=3114695 RepID=UPI0030D1B117